MLRKFPFLSENTLRDAVLIGLWHCNHERPHQSLGNRPPMPLPGPAPDTSKPIIRTDHLDGAIHQYVRAA